jgi:hypothetical protein
LGFRPQHQNIDGKLPQIGRSSERIQISGMFHQGAVTSTFGQLTTEERRRIVSARGADTEDLKTLRLIGDLAYPTVFIKMELNEPLNIDFGVCAQAKQQDKLRSVLHQFIESVFCNPPKSFSAGRD